MGKSGLSLAMKIFVVFCFIAAAAAKPQGSPAVGYADGRIIGGEEAPAHEFPWQISLRNLGSHICGGSIINKNQVITAAHCVEGALPILDSVVAGAHHRRLEGLPRWSITPAGTLLLSTTTWHSSPSQSLLTSVTPTCSPTCSTGLFLPNALQW